MGSDSVSRVRVQINGMDYSLRGKGTEEDLRSVATRVDKVMRELAAANPQLDQKRVAVLAAVNLADELHRLEGQYNELMELLDDKTRGNSRS